MRLATSSDEARISLDVYGTSGPAVLFPLRQLPWHPWGYVDALAGDCTLIIVDPRGHGESTHFEDIALYGLWKRCDDLLAAADEAGIDRFVAVGFSNAALTVTALACKTDRVKGVVCGGVPMTGVPEAQSFIDYSLEQREQSVGTYADGGTFDWGESAALYRDLASWSLPRMRIPAILYYGSEDPFADRIRAARSEHEALGFDVRELPGLDHDTAVSRADLVVPMIRELIARVF